MFTIQDANGIYQLHTLNDAISCAQLEQSSCRIFKDGTFVADFDGSDTWHIAPTWADVWPTHDDEF